ncbi:plasmid recombination protein, partial [Tenacibaculum discolor]|uniref:plasmid recombination protein n=1 Tax=Tenacibaculum discolor TaxID=361581 RepID=UPI00159BD84F
CLELVFSLPPNHQVDDRAYFSACVKWAAKAFGGNQNILSADIHRDEAAPHCHVLILPLIEGRMVGSDLVGNRQKLLAMQSQFHTEVAARFGFKKAPDRLTGLTKQSAVCAVLTKLKALADPVLHSVVWAP